MATCSTLENGSTQGCPRGDLRPPVTSFKPNIWGDIFTTFSLNDKVQEKYAEGIEALKKEVRSILMVATSRKLIILIDALVRLGLAYHFETEIEEKVEQIYNSDHDEDKECDMFTTALQFRLLRQHRYHVSCSVFDKFKDGNNKFQESLTSDVAGLLSLFEAAQIRTHGEDILEEAVAFTMQQFHRLLPQLEAPLKDQVEQALQHPFHRAVPIIEARLYIPIYEKDELKDEMILKLAKINFNYLQNLYRKELSELSSWWNKFDLKTKLPYARDRLIESYLWGASFHFEPQYADLRILVSKGTEMAAIIDDTYDNYATLDEAQLFTDILERWDMNEIDRLPDYMKIVYQFLNSVYEDYERDVAKQGKSYAAPVFKDTVKQIARAYNREQKWLMERRAPPFEDYMNNSVITSCVYVLFMILFPGMESANKETIKWLMSAPKLVISTAMMSRYHDNLGSHERESRDGLPTAIDCYMKHYGVSKQEALTKLAKGIEDAWKDVNEEWVMRSSIPKEMVEQFLNYSRASEVTYKNSEDGFTNPEKYLAPLINALFLEPIAI